MRASSTARKLRVTMLGSLPPQRGVSQYTSDLARELARRDDVRLDVLSFRSLYPRRLYPGGDPEDSSVRAVDVPGARTRRALRWWNPLGWVLAGLTLRGDIVHAQWWSFPLAPVYAVILGIARLRGKRVVMTVHNSEPHEGGLLRRLANRAVLPFAQRIVVHTEQNAVTLRGRVRPSRVAIVPIGVGTPRQVTVEDREAARRALNLDTATPVVLFHGNIRPYKGLSDLLAAFRFVAEVIPNARLIVAGQPWSSADDVHAGVAAHRLDEQVITRLAYLPSEELDQLFVAADLVVYPYTHFDAQSAAACDALRYGKAIVVSDVGGLPDLVRNPVAVVPPRRPDALANAIIGVLRDGVLRRSLERDAEALAAELAWPRIAEQTVHVYRAVSARGRHAASHEPARSSIGEIELRNTAKEATWR